MVFNLVAANNTIWSCFFFFFLAIDLNFLIPAVKYCRTPTTELAFLIQITTKEVKVEIDKHSVRAEAKRGKCSI